MALNDPISDLLTRIRNAKDAKHRFVDVRSSNVKTALVKVLKDHGFVENYLLDDNKGLMRVYLRYTRGRKSVINGLRRISKPSCRLYSGYQDIPKVLGGLGLVVVSTPKGIIDGEKARQEKVGGELICSVW